MFNSMKEMWRNEANCKGVDLSVFFVENEDGTISRKNINNAKKICEKCKVEKECLMYAISEDITFGIWGGLTPRDRKSMKKNLNIKDYSEMSSDEVNKIFYFIKNKDKELLWKTNHVLKTLLNKLLILKT